MKRVWWSTFFFGLLAAFLVADFLWSEPHDRFKEPPPWAIGQEKGEGGAHCSAVPAPR